MEKIKIDTQMLIAALEDNSGIVSYPTMCDSILTMKSFVLKN